jgi:hypothetical protein
MAETFKYLAIKNWEKYQPKDTKNLPWIRDYKDKDWDQYFSQLTVMQRYMLDAICRLRGRHGRNLPNDQQWIVRATAVLPRERHNATTAIQQLINSEFLALTNEQDTPLGEVRRGKDSKEKVQDLPQNTPAPDVPATPVIIDIKTPTDYDLEHKKENAIIEAAFEHYCCATERNRLTYRLTDQRRKAALTRLKDCLKLTKGDYDKAAELLQVAIDNLARSDWHMGRDPAGKGKKYCDWISNLFKSYEQMEKWWNT